MSIILTRLLDAFRKSGLSYYQLSNATGLARSTLQRYITGETEKIPMDAIDLIAKACGVSPAYIMGWTDDPRTGFSTYQPKKVGIAWSASNKPTAEGDRLDSQLVTLLRDLSPEEVQRVQDFVAGLKAARADGASRQG